MEGRALRHGCFCDIRDMHCILDCAKSLTRIAAALAAAAARKAASSAAAAPLRPLSGDLSLPAGGALSQGRSGCSAATASSTGLRLPCSIMMPAETQDHTAEMCSDAVHRHRVQHRLQVALLYHDACSSQMSHLNTPDFRAPGTPASAQVHITEGATLLKAHAGAHQCLKPMFQESVCLVSVCRWITLCLRLCMALHSAQSQPVGEAAGDAPGWEGLSSLRNATSVLINCRKRGTNKMG